MNLNEEDKKVLTEKAAEAMKKAREPKVLKSIGMRDGETDIRELPKKDLKQLEYRLLCDIWAYENSQHQSLVAIQVILMEIAEKMGIPIKEILNNAYQNSVPETVETKEEK
jgi:hypothetical protein